jgi:proteasome alpha subunit
MKDRADYARKGIARGRSVVVLSYDGGIAFVAENPSRALHKVSEIYDRIAFAAVGKYNEFENLRVAGVRLADLRGYSYDRSDVTGRGLANAYAQTLGTIFTQESKPYEVEIIVAEVNADPAGDQMYRLTYDGSVNDERGFVAMGGQAEQIATVLRDGHGDGMPLDDALRLAVRALSTVDGETRQMTPAQLEVAVLDRNRPKRKFKRLGGAQLERLARRAGLGLARTGSVAHHWSGEIFVAFATARDAAGPDDELDPLFAATVDATEEAVVNALWAAVDVTGRDGRTVHALPHDPVLELLGQAGRLA